MNSRAQEIIDILNRSHGVSIVREPGTGEWLLIDSHGDIIDDVERDYADDTCALVREFENIPAEDKS